MNRRNFIGKTLTTSALFGAGSFPLQALAAGEMARLTILHTNDTHSRIEPFPAASKYPNMGGAATRATLVKKIRQEEKNVLLFDSGDIFQGTPYFNYFGGMLELEVMSKIGYDAATIGNHDFDGGIEMLAKQISRSDFPFVNCNYDFTNTPVAGKVHKHIILKKRKLKIGITGCGVELNGLVPDKLYTNTKYLDPVKCVQEQVDILKHEKKCHFIICLSHLGYKYENAKVSDIVLAQNTSNIDLIIGGHTHTFLDTPTKVKNKDGKEVLINQVGWAGVQIGQLDYFFEKSLRKKLSNSQTVIVDKKSIEK